MDYIYQGPVILVLLVSNDTGGHCAVQHNFIIIIIIFLQSFSGDTRFIAHFCIGKQLKGGNSALQ